jgi:DNA-binding NtrC family response regulator
MWAGVYTRSPEAALSSFFVEEADGLFTQELRQIEKRQEVSSTKIPTKKDDALNDRQSVLIVDGSEENREVLQTVLERRGFGTQMASEPKQGKKLARQNPPDLIVYDLDSAPVSEEDGMGEWLGDMPSSDVSVVFLGTLRRQCPPCSRGEFIPKPYHYGPLLCKIEELLHSAHRKEAA